MTMYNYDKSPVSVGTLTTEIQAESGITTSFVSMTFREPEDLEITFSGSLSAGEQTLLDAVVSGHGGQFPIEPANLPSGDYESGMLIVTDGAGRTKWVDGFETTISGVDPTETHHLSTRKYVDDTVASGSLKYLQWSQSPTYNGLVYLLGWYIKTDGDVFIDDSPLVSATDPGYSSHFVLDVSSAAGTLPMTVVVSGAAVYEDTNEIFVAVDNLTVTGTGCYQTPTSYITAPSFYVANAGDNITCDIYRTSYWDCGNRNFTVRGCRMEFTPDQTTWSIQFKLYRIVDDGRIVTLDDKTFTDADEYPRAGHSLVGKYKRTDYNYFMHGGNNEGLIVEVDQFGINYFNLLLQYND